MYEKKRSASESSNFKSIFFLFRMMKEIALDYYFKKNITILFYKKHFFYLLLLHGLAIQFHSIRLKFFFFLFLKENFH